MTKSSAPLIIIMVLGSVRALGSGPAPEDKRVGRKETAVRILIYKETAVNQEVLVLPGRAAHLSPILLRGADRQALMQKVAETVDAVSLQEKTRPRREAP